ncbi:DUF1254 domain-containing protein [Synechococcus sp. CS-1326]|uniref:DUF1254 domain-containing protein n=1 Tax=Synechococcus sp. CS-1326 TaxID=2847978 RepID=UPI00223ADF78|nr:DUF1254 domain-containing protein [Synechococcus sp. CS-1326]MCT0213611.1 DUF1254 domain-containing protein [Synechococcus sp. CS-1326]
MLRASLPALLVGSSFLLAPLQVAAQVAPSPAEIRQIGREAYVYGFPMVDSYRIQYAYFADPSNPDYKAPYNQLLNVPRVFTPADTAVQTPNSDTPYSWLGLDLRREPLVLSVPPIEQRRYWSIQLIDLFTHNFAYLGSRSTGNGGGTFLIAGPNWTGSTPPGITKVIRSETDLALALYRTQLFNPADLASVQALQAQYKVQPLSAFLGGPAPAAVAPIRFIKPLSSAEQKTSLRFFEVMNALLPYAPVHPTEQKLRASFARIGIAPDQPFDVSKLSTRNRAALEAGMADGWADFAALKARIDRGEVTSGELFGTRDFLNNNYLSRMTAAVLGIYGNSREEALYPVYFVDAAGQKLDGSRSNYRLRFGPNQLPPVNSFWSLTLYRMPESLLYGNPLNRYLINSAMLPGLQRDPDGGLTLLVQNPSPGQKSESNWLPAPDGPFSLFLRLYWPKPEALSGSWKPPALLAEPLGAGVTAGPPAASSEAVTPQTYIRAETDRTFQNIVRQAGGVNRWFVIRNPTPLNQQTVVRMNLDTLYSASIVDTSKGATVTIPPLPKGRFMSVLLVDNDHYAPAVFYEPGTYALPRDTKYLAVVVRTQLFNPKDAAEIAEVNRLQDSVVVRAASADPLPPSRWDQASLKALTQRYEQEAKAYSSYKGMMGPRGTVDERTRHLAAAAAWGLNPEKDATYLNTSGSFDQRVCHTATYAVPENKAFWSITLYGEDGYMKHTNAVVNSSNVKLNPDGTFTVAFGSQQVCGAVANRVDVAPGWNLLMRIYRPGPSVLSGAYSLPKPIPTPPSQRTAAP